MITDQDSAPRLATVDAADNLILPVFRAQQLLVAGVLGPRLPAAGTMLQVLNAIRCRLPGDRA